VGVVGGTIGEAVRDCSGVLRKQSLSTNKKRWNSYAKKGKGETGFKSFKGGEGQSAKGFLLSRDIGKGTNGVERGKTLPI